VVTFLYESFWEEDKVVVVYCEFEFRGRGRPPCAAGGGSRMRVGDAPA
jgi:hypothetical protein